MQTSLFKLLSAWVPIAMSSLALLIVAVHVIASGPIREADEGASAHLWQLLMIGQVPVIGWFWLTRLVRNPRQGAVVLAAQVAAALVAVAPVLVLGL